MDNALKHRWHILKEIDLMSPIITSFSGKQDLQKQSLGMIKNMARWHAYDNIMRDIMICDRKNMDLAD